MIMGQVSPNTNVYSTSVILDDLPIRAVRQVHPHRPHSNLGIPAELQPDTGSRLPCQLDSSFPVAFVGVKNWSENVEAWPALHELVGVPWP